MYDNLKHYHFVKDNSNDKKQDVVFTESNNSERVTKRNQKLQKFKFFKFWHILSFFLSF